jgi:hypothetical protein
MEDTRVYLKLGDYEEQNLRIHQLEYKGGISQLFSLNVVFVIGAETFMPEDLIGQAAEIEIIPNSSDSFYIKGVIQDCAVQDTMDALKQQQYQCTIVPKLAFLQNQPENYLYRDQQIFDLILFLLTGYTEQNIAFAPGYRKKGVYDYQGFQNINGDSEVCFLLSHPQDSEQYPTFGQLLQYQQSAYDFLTQLLALNGLSYFFDHSKSHMPLVITDCIHDDSFLNPLDVNFEKAQQVDRLTTVVYQSPTSSTSLSVGESVVRGYSPDQSSAIIRALQSSTITTDRNNQSASQVPVIASTPAEAENLSIFYQGHFDAVAQVSPIKGQGFVYPGQLIKIDNVPIKQANRTVYFTKLSWVLTMDSSAFNEIRTSNWQGQCIDNQYPYYALPKRFEAPKSLRGWQVETVVSGEFDLSDNDYNTLDQNGRYCISPPKNFNKLGGHKQCLLGLRLLQTFHSEDHKQASPLAQGTQVSLNFEEGNLQRPFIDGTLNSAEHPILTDTANSQNMVWQDEKFNRLSFLSTGAFMPFTADGHQSATELYAPNYDGAGSFSGLRIGDAVSSSQLGASEPGIHWETSGKWREIHEDSHVELFGMLQPTNAKEQPTIPVYRLFTQLNPTEDYPYHRIENITPDELTREFTIGEGSTEHKHFQHKVGMQTHTKAKQHQININNDEEIYLYQNLQESYLAGESFDTTSHEYKINELNEKHLTKIHTVTVTSESLYEYYKASHIEKHLHKNNIYSANNITFNEVIHNTTTTGLSINAEETVYNAAIINQVSTGTNTITATKSVTQKGAVLNNFADTRILTQQIFNQINLEPNPYAVLKVRIQDRFAKKPEDGCAFINRIYPWKVEVRYIQENQKTGQKLWHNESPGFQKDGTLLFWHLGTKTYPLKYGDDTYVTSSIEIHINSKGAEDQMLYITHLNQEPILFNSIEETESKIVPVNIATRPSNRVLIFEADWNKQPPKQGLTLLKPLNRVIPNIQEYTVGIGILEPTVSFNFRQGRFIPIMTEEEYDTFCAIAPYFKDSLNKNDQINNIANLDEIRKQKKIGVPPTQFTPEEIACFKQSGQNVTIFIHGYNSVPGGYPQHIACVDAKVSEWYEFGDTHRDVLVIDYGYKSTIGWTVQEAITLQEYNSPYQYGDALIDGQSVEDKPSPLDLTYEALFGNGSYAWQIQLQTNLNVAAGFTGEDYSLFNRIVLIQWMGDPATPDYMAATVSSEFPATKVFGLIKQLQNEGIKINLMAHSLGNEVLIRVLDKVGEAGLKPVDHVFMWDAAIPDTAFETTKTNYLPMKINGKDLNYGYNFIHAQKGVKKATILYSPLDNILGPIQLKSRVFILPEKDSSDGPDEWITVWQSLKGIMYIVCEMMLEEIKQKNTENEPFWLWLWDESIDAIESGLWNILEAFGGYADTLTPEAKKALLDIAKEKLQDPAAGFPFVMTSIPLAILDPVFQKHFGEHVKLSSIYHLANTFVYPFSWIIESEQNIETLYNQLLRTYGHFDSKKTEENPSGFNEMQPTLELQTEYFKETLGYAGFYNTIDVFIGVFQTIAISLGVASIGILEAFTMVRSVQSGLNQAQDLSEPFMTLFLTGLMINPSFPSSALPARPAMGYSGLPDADNNPLLISGKVHQTAQLDLTSKSIQWPDGTPQCVDHCAMSFPASEGMNKWVYSNYLFGYLGQDGGRFDFFGNYPMT